MSRFAVLSRFFASSLFLSCLCSFLPFSSPFTSLSGLRRPPFLVLSQLVWRHQLLFCSSAPTALFFLVTKLFFLLHFQSHRRKHIRLSPFASLLRPLLSFFSLFTCFTLYFSFSLFSSLSLSLFLYFVSLPLSSSPLSLSFYSFSKVVPSSIFVLPFLFLTFSSSHVCAVAIFRLALPVHLSLFFLSPVCPFTLSPPSLPPSF